MTPDNTMGQLRERLHQQFPLEPIPSAPIVDTLDDEGVIETFSGRSWNDFSALELRDHSHAITFLRDDALLYYLPAFILATVEDRETADVIPESLLRTFRGPGGLALAGRLTAEQRKLLSDFFSAFVGDDACGIRDLANAWDVLEPGWNDR